jgi:hypothetical protein
LVRVYGTLFVALRDIDAPRPAPRVKWERGQGGKGELRLDGEVIRIIDTDKAKSIVPTLDEFESRGWPLSVPYKGPIHRITDVVKSLNDKQSGVMFRVSDNNISWQFGPGSARVGPVEEASLS